MIICKVYNKFEVYNKFILPNIILLLYFYYQRYIGRRKENYDRKNILYVNIYVKERF